MKIKEHCKKADGISSEMQKGGSKFLHKSERRVSIPSNIQKCLPSQKVMNYPSLKASSIISDSILGFFLYCSQTVFFSQYSRFLSCKFIVLPCKLCVSPPN